MNFSFFKTLWSRPEIKVFIFSTLSGGALQFIARQYIKNHPELLEKTTDNNEELTSNKSNRKPHLLPPSGAIVEFTAGGIAINIGQIAVRKAILNFLASNGLITGLTVGGGIALSKIPATAISTFLSDAFPQNLPHLEKKKFILANGEKIYLDQCDQNLKYLFEILKNPDIPFEEKQKTTNSILQKYVNLNTANGRRNFILCIVFILYIFSIQDMSSYYILLKNLINAIKQGKISKVLARAIIRRLKRKGLPIDPELIDIVSS